MQCLVNLFKQLRMYFINDFTIANKQYYVLEQELLNQPSYRYLSLIWFCFAQLSLWLKVELGSGLRKYSWFTSHMGSAFQSFKILSLLFS